MEENERGLWPEEARDSNYGRREDRRFAHRWRGFYTSRSLQTVAAKGEKVMSNAVAEAVNSEGSTLPLRTVESLPVPNTPIQQDPKKLGGHPTIGAVRMQADVLINYLASGYTLDEFLADYDGVTKEEALAVLALVKQAILDGMLTGVPLRDEDPF